jgi:hypothetical protein
MATAPKIATAEEILACKRAIVVLQEINTVAVKIMKEPDKLAPVKADLLALIKVIKRLETAS